MLSNVIISYQTSTEPNQCQWIWHTESPQILQCNTSDVTRSTLSA